MTNSNRTIGSAFPMSGPKDEDVCLLVSKVLSESKRLSADMPHAGSTPRPAHSEPARYLHNTVPGALSVLSTVVCLFLDLVQCRAGDASRTSVVEHDAAVADVAQLDLIQRRVRVVEAGKTRNVSTNAAAHVDLCNDLPGFRTYSFLTSGPVTVPYLPDRSPTSHVWGCELSQGGVSPRTYESRWPPVPVQLPSSGTGRRWTWYS